MRIWIINHYAGAPGLGSGWRHWELGRRWARSGVDVRVFTASTSIGGVANAVRAGIQRLDGMQWHFIQSPAYSGNGIGRLRNIVAFNRGVCCALRECGREHGAPDLILASSPQPLVWPTAAAAARALGASFVPEVRDLWPESLREFGGLPRFHPFVMWCARAVRKGYAAGDAIASSLPGIARALQPFNITPDRCIVIPNGVDLSPARGQNAVPPNIATLIATARRSGKRILLYAGALGVPNAMGQLFDALELLSGDERGRLACLIIGDGTEREHLASRCLGVGEGCVHMLGALPLEVVRGIIPECDAGFQTWLDLDVYRFGTSAQKFSFYMGEGLPMVHAAPRGHGLVSQHGLGWECPCAHPEALAGALRNFLNASEADLITISNRCREYAREHLDWDAIATRAHEQLAAVAHRRTRTHTPITNSRLVPLE